VRSILAHAFAFGLVLSVVVGALLLAVLRTNAEILLHDYPPDIRAKWGPMTSRTRRQRVPVVCGFLAAILTVVAWSLATLPTDAARELTFASAFAHFAVMFGTFNAFDWLVIDCALVYWRPRFIVLPGTEGMAGYRNYWFHFRGFVLGIPVVAVGSAVAAAMVSLLFRGSL
jgi:hypothetical protein